MIGTALTIVATAWLVVAETQRLRSRFVAKPLASLGFLLVPLVEGAEPGARSWWILIGLVLGLVGDVALMYGSSSAFLAGLASFLLGHVAYVIAFAQDGVRSGPALVGALAMTAVAILTLRWLRPHLEMPFSVAVPIYVLVIAAMVISAAGTPADQPLVTMGAATFAASDLFVARDRFVESVPSNRVIGLPLYYLGQLLIAWSIV